MVCIAMIHLHTCTTAYSEIAPLLLQPDSIAGSTSIAMSSVPSLYTIDTCSRTSGWIDLAKFD